MKAKIKLRVENKTIGIESFKSSTLITDHIIDKWQDMVDLEQKFFKSKSVMITVIEEDYLQVLLTSRNHDNPYEAYYKRPLGLGSYCETVIGRGQSFYVEDALKDDVWKTSPDAVLDMIHYMGAPIKWADGNIFGTICILNHHARSYTDKEVKLFDTFRQNVEKDLLLLEKNNELDQHYKLIKQTRSMLVEREKKQHKKHLLSSISHEISTPLGVALTTSSYLDYVVKQSDEIPLDRILEGASLVEKNVKQAADMLKSFKGLSYQSTIKNIDLYFFIKSLMETLTYDFKKHQVSLRIDVKEDTEITIDINALSQIILNLVLNAVHHAFDGCENRVVTIKGSVKDQTLYMSIMDNGIGIDEVNGLKIFQPFVRYDHKTEGSGLGLSIVKEIVEEKLSGRLSMTSEKSLGTTFMVEIPLEVSDENN